jgi:putative transposase
MDTISIAVGSRSFVEKVKALLGYRAKGREVIGGNEGYQLREGSGPYKVLFGVGNDDIGLENTYFWGGLIMNNQDLTVARPRGR